MSQQMRKSKRSDIDVSIMLQGLSDGTESSEDKSAFSVQVINLSQGGIAFRTTQDLQVGNFYDTLIKLSNGEKIQAALKIAWIQNTGADERTYGCRFIGMNMEDRFKIDCYQIVEEQYS